MSTVIESNTSCAILEHGGLGALAEEHDLTRVDALHNDAHALAGRVEL